jgi:hypothetical protein
MTKKRIKTTQIISITYCIKWHGTDDTDDYVQLRFKAKIQRALYFLETGHVLNPKKHVTTVQLKVSQFSYEQQGENK